MSAGHVQSPARERAILFSLTAVHFTHILDFMILMPLGSHLMRTFDITAAQFSHLVAAYGLAAAIAGFGGGFVLDRFDRRSAFLVLYAGFGVATLACALSQGYLQLLVARCAAGSFGGVAGSLVISMVGDVIPPERRGRSMAVVAAAFPLASVAGVPLGLELASRYDWQAAFYFLAVASGIVFAVAFRLLPSLRNLHPPAHPLRQMAEILRHPVHLRGFQMSAALVFGGGIVIPFLAPSMVANVGVPETRLNLIYLAGGICTFLSTPWFGRLSDRHDKLHVLAWVSVASCLTVLVLTHLPPSPMAVAMLVTAVFMVTMSGRFAPAMSMLSNAVEAKYRAGFMSVNSAVQQAAGGLGNLAAGMLVVLQADGTLAGYGSVGFVAVGCMILTVFLAMRVRALAPAAARPGHAQAVPLGAVE